MKKLLFVVVISIFIGMNSYSQDYSILSEKNFDNVEDYKKEEPLVLECANYILGSSIKENELNKTYCLQYLMKWMSGTPDYMFSLGEEVTSYCKKDLNLSSVYFASLAKAAVENEKKTIDSDTINSTAADFFLDYCEKPENGVKKNKAIKTALKNR